jgi:hypothetical protein
MVSWTAYTLQIERLMQSYGTQHNGTLSKQEFTALIPDKLSALFDDCLPLQARTQLVAFRSALVRYTRNSNTAVTPLGLSIELGVSSVGSWCSLCSSAAPPIAAVYSCADVAVCMMMHN